MPVPGRRPSWQQQLRQTRASDALMAGKPDRFPLTEVQEIANWLLRDRSPATAFTRRRSVIPHTDECDVLFANELSTVKGELAFHEAAIIASLHLLSYDQARGQIFSLRPSSVPDPTDVFFDHRLSVYLQCIILSQRANPDVCSEDEVTAAKELFGVAKGRVKGFPSILRLLQAVGRETCEALMPVALVKKVLKKSHYRDNLVKELEELRRARKWFDAYKLAYDLRNVIGLPRADKLLCDIFPDYTMWATWRPNVKRITSWEGENLAPYRKRLAPVLDLEGPDTTGQQRKTLRMSSPGAFAGLGHPGFSSDRHILDRLLDDLDTSLTIGPATVDLLVALCIETNSLSPRCLDQLEAAMELRHDPSSKALAGLIRAITSKTSSSASTMAFAAALPVLTIYPQLRKQFGAVNDLARRSPTALSAAQHQFCRSLAEDRASERLAVGVLALGNALLHADWLHEHWQPAYINMLRNLPTERETKEKMVMLNNTHSHATKISVLDFLATRLGGALLSSSFPTTPSPLSPSSPGATPTTPLLPVVTEDPIWYSQLDIERSALRRLLRGTAFQHLSSSITTACLNQSLAEPDTLIREITRIIVDNTDQVCVNLTIFLGKWIASSSSGGKLHESWRTLLLQMMRERPPGMLERCGNQLTLSTWESWVDNLTRVFGDKHLDVVGDGSIGVAGFTNARFSEWTQRKQSAHTRHKMGGLVMRSVSTTTTITRASATSGSSDFTASSGTPVSMASP
ncbi:hypothetical protein B0H66DRAFT_558884 [Apodospora peruviana]|uniref:Uncharacterized protein n=1 Tax=Apodospora peruviana TaxID=516989 RepID=A0AAE0I6C8_9PEZI|nr:hypothetical protein B0H66DRAFT_558884 [Apodospora peruviana]